MPEFIALEHLLACGRAPDAPVVAAQTMDTQGLNQADFAMEVAGWHAAFARAPGRRYALYFDDSARFAAALLGVWHAGKCAHLYADVQPATLARLAQQVDGWAGDLPMPDRVVPVAGHFKAAWPALDLSLPCLVVHTSGSTGTPLAVPKRLAQLSSEITTLERCFGSRLGAARVLATVSHQHIYGLLFGLLWPLCAGRPIAPRRLAFPEDVVATLATGLPSVLVSSPAHLKRLPSHLPWADVRHSLRGVFSSGGPLPDSALPACEAFLGQTPIEVYGSTETGGIGWRQRRAADATWQPLPGVELRLDSGYLEVRSPHLAEPRWTRCADRVRLLDDGFELLGRTDRIVKVEEKRVSLAAFEQVLLQTGLVSEVCVLPLPGARTVLAVAAVPSVAGWAVIDTEGKRTLDLQLRAALAIHAEASVLPRRWRYTWALPTDSQGKRSAAALRALFDPRRPPARLLEHTAQKAQLLLEVEAGLPYFEGHFPQAPVLPGVVQIEWALRFGRELFPLPPLFQRLERLKFQRAIVPGTRLVLGLDFQVSHGVLSYQFNSDAGAHATGRIVLGSTP